MPVIGLRWGQDVEWARQFAQEHGRQPTEQEWWEHRFSRQIAGWTDADWNVASVLRSSLYAAGITIKSGDARWTLDEVTVIDQVIHNILVYPKQGIAIGSRFVPVLDQPWQQSPAGTRVYQRLYFTPIASDRFQAKTGPVYGCGTSYANEASAWQGFEPQ